MTLDVVSMELEVAPPPRNSDKDKPRKRRLEPEQGLEEEEETDSFDFDGLPTSRRGRKVGRRVSGVYREIQALQNIGRDAEVMKLVFTRMPTLEMLQAGEICPMWLTVAYHVLREKLENKSFLRLWKTELSSQYLWMQWELHFHGELMGLPSDDSNMEESSSSLPLVQAIISVGNRSAYGQFIDEDARLPYRQEHIYAICDSATVTAPDLSFVDNVGNGDRFGRGPMIIESLFIPKSDHFTMKAFGLECSKDEWTVDAVRGKVELFMEDLGDCQSLKALLLIKYMESEIVQNFLQQFNHLYSDAQILAGDAEEVGCNRIDAKENPAAVGYAFYAGPGANVRVYGVDFLRNDSQAILERMKRQVDSGKNSVCFMFSHDSRPMIEGSDDEDTNDEMNWNNSVAPEPPVQQLLEEVRKWIPKTPMVGVRSLYPVMATSAAGDSNIYEESTKELTWGFLLVTYN